MTGGSWYIGADLVKGCGVFSGIRVVHRPEGWFLVDGRGGKTRARGPYADSRTAMDLVEAGR